MRDGIGSERGRENVSPSLVSPNKKKPVCITLPNWFFNAMSHITMSTHIHNWIIQSDCFACAATLRKLMENRQKTFLAMPRMQHLVFFFFYSVFPPKLTYIAHNIDSEAMIKFQICDACIASHRITFALFHASSVYIKSNEKRPNMPK